MASTQTRQLRELLQEEQDPFVLETYLEERGYPKTSSKPERDKVSKKKSNNLQKIKKGIIYSSKLLKSVYKKLVRTSKSCNDEMKPDNDKDQTTTSSLHDQDQDRSFSVHSSSYSREEAESATKSISLQDQDYALLSLYSSSSCEETESTTKGQGEKDTEQEEDSILTASLFGLLVCSTTQKPNRVQGFELQEIVHCKRLMMQSQQLMLDCVRELVESVNGEFLGSEEIGKVVLDKMRDWGKKKDMDMEFRDDQWSDLRLEKSEVVAAIGDEILEELKDQLVMDMVCE